MKPIRLDPENVSRILICQLRQIGDVLLSTPSAQLLKQAFPQAEVHVFTEKKCADVLTNNPDIDLIWAVDRSKLTHLGKEIGFYRRVASQGYDLVLDFQQLPRCRWVVAFSRAKVRLTYPPPWYNRWLYTHWRVQDTGYSAMAKASLLKVLGIEWQGEKPQLVLTDKERAEAEGLLQIMGIAPGTRLVTVDPTHRRSARRWPLGHFARFIEMAAQAHPDCRFLVLYGPGEHQDAEAVLAQVPESAKHACLTTEKVLPLRTAAAVIEQADLHLGNCSGPRHLAVAVGTPTLITLGATSWAWTYPGPGHKALSLGLDCQPCNENTCPKADPPPCLDGLAPETVLSEFTGLLDEYGRTNGLGSPRSEKAAWALAGGPEVFSSLVGDSPAE